MTMTAAVATTGIDFDPSLARADFPILSRHVRGRPLVYLDSAASAQKPRQVIEAERRLYEEEYANVHRGVHWLSQTATERFEEARASVRRFINAAEDREVVFVRGGTEGINLVAQSWGRTNLKEGDRVLISTLEHHANIVPWHLLAAERGLVVEAIPIFDDGQIDMEAYRRLLDRPVKLVALTQMSNALGTITPAAEMIRMAHDAGARVMLDSCQAISHGAVDVQALDCDFMVFSGHKIYGPTGIGVLYGKAELLEKMPPWQGGGEMIARVTMERSTFKGIPHRFEAGTPAIAQAVGLKAALDYVAALGLERIADHEAMLRALAVERLSAIEGLSILGTHPAAAAIVSFTMDGIHPHDVGTIVDHEGVAVRVGHHCAQPLMDRFDVAATVRASFALYNTADEIDALVAALEQTRTLFS